MPVEPDDRPVVPVADFDRPLPSGINVRGRGAWFWSRATELGENGKPKVLFTPSEMVLLEEVCIHLDMADGMDRSIRKRLGAEGGSFYVMGVQGSIAADPLIATRLRTSATVAALVKQIDLPDEHAAAAPVAGAQSLREHQSKAGQNRWKKKPAVGS